MLTWRGAQLASYLELLHITQVRRFARRRRRLTRRASQDFIYSARAYGKIIISETFLPDEQKTIRPVRGLCGLLCGRR